MTRNRRATSTPPAASIRSTLERLHDFRPEQEGVLEQREVDGFGVPRPDHNVIWAPATLDDELRRLPQEGVGLRKQAQPDGLVGELAGKSGLLLHVVLELIEPQIDAA